MLTYTGTREEPTRPSHVQFGLLSAAEIRRVSVVKVTETQLYYRGLPMSGSLMDPLMGSVDRRHMCASCVRSARTCQGHLGHMELAFPIYHVCFLDTILKVLRCQCVCCARLVATEEELAAASAQGLTAY